MLVEFSGKLLTMKIHLFVLAISTFELSVTPPTAPLNMTAMIARLKNPDFGKVWHCA